MIDSLLGTMQRNRRWKVSTRDERCNETTSIPESYYRVLISNPGIKATGDNVRSRTRDTRTWQISWLRTFLTSLTISNEIQIRNSESQFYNVTFRKVFTVDCTAQRIAQNWLLYAFTLHKFLVPKNTIVPGDSENVNVSRRSGSCLFAAKREVFSWRCLQLLLVGWHAGRRRLWLISKKVARILQCTT